MTPRGGAIELIPGKLYYITLRSGPTESSKQAAHFWSADEFSYWNFFLDWGPLSLGNLYRFCRTMNFKLKSERLQGKTIYVYSGSHAHKRTNAAFLLGAWLLLYGGRTPEQAFAPFQDVFPPFPPFHDASPCVCTFDLTIPHCLRGLQKACRFGFFDFSTFNVEEYEHYEQVENGDMNWLIDGKFLAFAGPHSRSEMTREGYRTLTPRNYIPYFKKNNVTLVVRLNKKYYDEQLFLDAGIGHMEAYFLDGSVPPANILRQFITACETTPGAVAVHCKAGLGRTGTCIGCYIMKHYSFTAAEVIGWMRICRPGSVIGPQQHYLERMEGPMHREGIAFRKQAGMIANPRRAPGSLTPRQEAKARSWFSRTVIGEAAHAGEAGKPATTKKGTTPRDTVVTSSSSRHSEVHRPSSSSYDMLDRDPSVRRPGLHSDRQGYQRDDNSKSTNSGRRKSTGTDRSQQKQASPLFPIEGGDGVETVSRHLTQLELERGDVAIPTKGGGGGGGGTAYGSTTSTQRTRYATGNTGARRGTTPFALSEGTPLSMRSSAAHSAGSRRGNDIAAVPKAIARDGAAASRNTLDVWEEAVAARKGGTGGVVWGPGGRTQGDYLLQQRARASSRASSRR